MFEYILPTFKYILVAVSYCAVNLFYTWNISPLHCLKMLVILYFWFTHSLEALCNEHAS